jgi:MFS family permease
MLGFNRIDQYRLLNIHYLFWSVSGSLASGFIGAFLLGIGFSLPDAIATYAGFYVLRYMLRFVALHIVRTFGFRRAIISGTIIYAMQFIFLLHTDQTLWLLVWIFSLALAESLYWPIFHAATSVIGSQETRGRDLALRQTLGTVISIICPIIGGLLLVFVGPSATFLAGSFFVLLSAVPIFYMDKIPAGHIPSVKESFQVSDWLCWFAFAADGWITAGLGVAWPMILFSLLHENYAFLGYVNAATSIIGAIVSYFFGSKIDKGKRHNLLKIVVLVFIISTVLRSISTWYPEVIIVANTLSAMFGGLYGCVLMSVVYNRAKKSGEAYFCQSSADMGWDIGAFLGCLVAAYIAFSGITSSLILLPTIIGILVLQYCVKNEPENIHASSVVLATPPCKRTTPPIPIFNS